jgi:valyl-tRNA synthetase
MVKPRLYNPLTPQEKQTAQYGLRLILKYLLSLLHPFMPFITEEIWHWFNPTSLAKAPWPRFQDLPRDKSAEREMGFFMKVVTSIRTLRSEHNIPPQEKMPEVLISLSTKHTQLEKVITENVRYLKTLCKVEEVKTGVKLSPPEGSVVSVIENGEIFLPLPKASLQREREKIEKEYQKIKFEREALEKRLSEESFLTRAPQEVVNKVKEKYTLFKMKEAKLQANLAHLQKALEATRSRV